MCASFAHLLICSLAHLLTCSPRTEGGFVEDEAVDDLHAGVPILASAYIAMWREQNKQQESDERSSAASPEGKNEASMTVHDAAPAFSRWWPAAASTADATHESDGTSAGTNRWIKKLLFSSPNWPRRSGGKGGA